LNKKENPLDIPDNCAQTITLLKKRLTLTRCDYFTSSFVPMKMNLKLIF